MATADVSLNKTARKASTVKVHFRFLFSFSQNQLWSCVYCLAFLLSILGALLSSIGWVKVCTDMGKRKFIICHVSFVPYLTPFIVFIVL
jgi:hypothetical protein